MIKGYNIISSSQTFYLPPCLISSVIDMMTYAPIESLRRQMHACLHCILHPTRLCRELGTATVKARNSRPSVTGPQSTHPAAATVRPFKRSNDCRVWEVLQPSHSEREQRGEREDGPRTIIDETTKGTEFYPQESTNQPQMFAHCKCLFIQPPTHV